MPAIQGPLEFGIAVMAWWNDIQPEFRKGEGGNPRAVYDTDAAKDPWSGLQKGGTNSLVCVLTLLVWWGQCAGVHSKWQDSLLPLWKAAVLDMTRCMEKMLTSMPTPKRPSNTVSDPRDAKQ